VTAALVDSGEAGAWATAMLAESLAAPALMPAEVAHVLRRSSSTGGISPDTASQAHRELLDLPVVLFPYRPFGPRVWELRDNLTAYDALYVALAEELDAPLATLDGWLRGAAGPRCGFTCPPSMA